MEAMMLLLFVGAVLVTVAVGAFISTVRSGSFDHADRLSLLPLETERSSKREEEDR
jgi:nitrogen fixation-related uncharacterized protein